MRIIKRGTDPSTKLYEGTCNNCGTVVEFAKHEAKYHGDQRDGNYLTVICPVCYASINVNV